MTISNQSRIYDFFRFTLIVYVLVYFIPIRESFYGVFRKTIKSFLSNSYIFVIKETIQTLFLCLKYQNANIIPCFNFKIFIIVCKYFSVAGALQIPLQPLYDNLDTYTYEVFEKDPIKYMKYQEAIVAALEDIGGASEKIVMVLGAGRGPLVRAVLNASKKSRCAVKIYVIEKNACAINTLHAHMRDIWLTSSRIGNFMIDFFMKINIC